VNLWLCITITPVVCYSVRNAYLRGSSLANLTQPESGNRFLRRLFYCPFGRKGRWKMANKSNLRTCLAISIFLLVMAGLAQAATITVGPGAGYDFDTIQAGIDAAVDGDTVLVVPGEYVITEPITFRGKAVTVKSEAGLDQTTIRMDTPADTNRGSVVFFENNETDASVLEGFTITGGRGSYGLSAGGGIYFDASSGTVKNCTIVQNTAGYAGGVFCRNLCSPKLIDCIIAENSASGSGGGGRRRVRLLRVLPDPNKLHYHSELNERSWWRAMLLCQFLGDLNKLHHQW